MRKFSATNTSDCSKHSTDNLNYGWDEFRKKNQNFSFQNDTKIETTMKIKQKGLVI